MEPLRQLGRESAEQHEIRDGAAATGVAGVLHDGLDVGRRGDAVLCCEAPVAVALECEELRPGGVCHPAGIEAEQEAWHEVEWEAHGLPFALHGHHDQGDAEDRVAPDALELPAPIQPHAGHERSEGHQDAARVVEHDRQPANLAALDQKAA